MQIYDRNNDDLNLHSMTKLNVRLALLLNTVCHNNVPSELYFYNVKNKIKSKLQIIIELT